VPDEAFLEAARILAASVDATRRSPGALYPPVADLRAVARAVAIATVRLARDSGYGRQFRDEEIEPAVTAAMWWPDYLPFEPA
jgi:malate dehydrogenase (oxaloacetate-decarboxylating)